MKTNSKHTPGPWTTNTDRYLISEPTSRIVGHVADSTEADARLIAAAPEMLEALVEVYQTLLRAGKLAREVGYDGTAESYEIQATDIVHLIAKARGES